MVAQRFRAKILSSGMFDHEKREVSSSRVVERPLPRGISTEITPDDLEAR